MRSVVLPAPLGPISAVKEPRSTVASTSSKIDTPPRRTETFCREMAGSCPTSVPSQGLLQGFQVLPHYRFVVVKRRLLRTCGDGVQYIDWHMGFPGYGLGHRGRVLRLRKNGGDAGGFHPFHPFQDLSRRWFLFVFFPHD